MIILQLLIGFMVVLVAYVLVLVFLLSAAYLADIIFARTGWGDKTSLAIAFVLQVFTVAISWWIGAYFVP